MQKVALVTGGARGIGRAIAEDLRSDHRVVVTWRSTVPDGLPADIIAIRADLTKPGAALAVIEQVMLQLGRLDVIVNNAGVVELSPKESFDAGASAAILAVNLLAPQALLAAALPHLKAGCAIVNISSVNAVFPPRDAATYGASKAALNLWTRAMAKELGPSGIRVNAVAPGAVNLPEQPRSSELTGLFVADTALRRIGEPRDVARAVRFLLSEEADFITGEVLTVSRGYRL